MKKLVVESWAINHPIVRSLSNILECTLPILSKYYEIILVTDIESDKINPCKSLVSDIITFKREINGIKNYLLKYLPFVETTVRKINPNFYWNIRTYLLSHFENVTSISTLHDLFPLYKESKRKWYRRYMFKHLIKRTLKNAKGITVPTQFTLNELKNKIGNGEKVKVIYNPINFNTLYKSKTEKGEFLLFIGRISFWKGTDILLKAIEKFHGFGIKTIFAGKCVDKILCQKLEVLSTKYEVEYKGFITDEEKATLLSSAKLFVYPSRYDGFGLPPLEAAYYKTPVVMSNIPVLLEVTQGKGVYFDIERGAEDLGRKIIDILEGKRDPQVEELYQVACSYTPEKYVNEFVKFLSSLEKSTT